MEYVRITMKITKNRPNSLLHMGQVSSYELMSILVINTEVLEDLISSGANMRLPCKCCYVYGLTLLTSREAQGGSNTAGVGLWGQGWEVLV